MNLSIFGLSMARRRNLAALEDSPCLEGVQNGTTDLSSYPKCE